MLLRSLESGSICLFLLTEVGRSWFSWHVQCHGLSSRRISLATGRIGLKMEEGSVMIWFPLSHTSFTELSGSKRPGRSSYSWLWDRSSSRNLLRPWNASMLKWVKWQLLKSRVLNLRLTMKVSASTEFKWPRTRSSLSVVTPCKYWRSSPSVVSATGPIRKLASCDNPSKLPWWRFTGSLLLDWSEQIKFLYLFTAHFAVYIQTFAF